MPPKDMAAVFNEAFQRYFVPVFLDEVSLRTLIERSDIALDRSLGLFEKDKARAFLLQGFRKLGGVSRSYVGGLGVVPTWRKRGLATRLLRESLDLAAGYASSSVLEVIEENRPALDLYQRFGYRTIRRWGYWNRTAQSPSPGELPEELRFRVVSFDESLYDRQNPDTTSLSWKEEDAAIRKPDSGYSCLEAWKGSHCVGRLFIDMEKGSLARLSVTPGNRGQGIGTAILKKAALLCRGRGLKFPAVDTADRRAEAFLIANGFRRLLLQRELKLDFPSV